MGPICNWYSTLSLSLQVCTAPVINEQSLKMEAKFDQFLKTYTTNSAENKGSIIELKKGVDNINIQLQKVEQDITSIDVRVKAVEDKAVEDFNDLDQQIKDVVKSVQFTSDKYDSLTTDIKALQEENRRQKADIDDLTNKLENETANSNAKAQYYRSIHHVKIHGVPFQKGEEPYKMVDGKKVSMNSSHNMKTFEIVKNIIQTAGFNFDTTAIDVCHRTSNYYYSPILVRFTSLYFRQAFYNQRNLLRRITVQNLDVTTVNEELGKWREERRTNNNKKDWSKEFPYIVIHDHLTKFNTDLLNEARTVGKRLKFAYPAYFSNGVVQMKQREDTKPMIIRSHADLRGIN